MTTTNTLQLYKAEIEEYMDQEAGMLPVPLYSQLFGVKDTNKLFTYLQQYSTGTNLMSEVGEMGMAVEIDAQDGYGLTIKRKIFRNKMTFSSDLFETDQHSKIKELAVAIRRKPRYTRDVYVMGIIRNAFNPLITWSTGKPLASVAQPYKDGSGTYSTTFADGLQRGMDYDAVKLLEDSLYNMNSDSGNVTVSGAETRKKVIVCTPFNRETAFQIAKVEDRYDTAERAGNYFFKGANFDVVVTKFIGHSVATQAGETAVAQTDSTNYWDRMWGIMDAELAKKYVSVEVATGYEKFGDEIVQGNQAIVKYAYDKFTYGVVDPRFGAWSKANNETITT